MGKIVYRAALAALVCVLAAAGASRAGEPGKDAEALAKQRAIEAAEERRALAEELAERRAAKEAASKKAAAEKTAKAKKKVAAAAAVTLRPRFTVGEKTVEAVKGGKVIWKLDAKMPVGGVIVERSYWYVFSKDETKLARVQARSGKLTYSTRFRVHNKGEAVKLVDQYLALLKPVKLTPEIKKRIEECIKNLGSLEFTVRDAASQELVKIGKVALPALQAATKSKDLETAERAKVAIEHVQATGVVAALRGLGWSTKLVIYKRGVAANQALGKCATELAAAEKAGKKDEVARLKIKLAEAGKRLKALGDLQKKVLGYRGGLPVFGGLGGRMQVQGLIAK